MTYCTNLNESSDLNNKLGHQFLIETKDDKNNGGEDIDITNQELIHLITMNNNLDTKCIDDRINGNVQESKFSDIVQVKKNFMTLDEDSLNSFNRTKFMEKTMYNDNCDFDAKYPSRIKAVDRRNKSIIMTKST